MQEFKPVINEALKPPEFRPYMIETAWDYYVIAHQGYYHKNYIKLSLSCLAIEIILKSFNAEVINNCGKTNEQYRPNKKIRSLKNAHDLIGLLEAMEQEYRDFLFDDNDEEVLRIHRGFFCSTQYGYESTASIYWSDAISKLALMTICKTIYLYKEKKCLDEFILWFDVNEAIFGNIKNVLLIDGFAP